MSHYKFLDAPKNINGVEHRRIQATRDLPQQGVKAGDVGGWVAKSARIGKDAWVSASARIGKGTWVGDDVLIGEDVWVGDDVVIGKGSQIGKGSCICEGSQIGKGSQISEGSQIDADAWIGKDSLISKGAWIHRGARIGDHAWIDGSCHYFQAMVFTSRRLPLSLYRTKNGGHNVTIGCESGDIDYFEELFKRDKWVQTGGAAAEAARPEMLALCAMMRERVARWSE